MNSTTEIRARIGQMAMTPLQFAVIALCWFINAFDGFDVLAIAFTAPAIRAEWNLSPEQLGMVFGSGLTGMMLGSFFLAPAADYIGRRKTILISLCFVAIGMFLTSYAENKMELMILRLVTGLAIGSLLASLNTTVAEFSSDKQRDFMINIYSLGYTFGVIVGGVASVYLINYYGWQSVYILGALATTLLLVVTYFLMPESIDFLLTRQPKSALNDINRTLLKMGLPELSELPPKIINEKNAGNSFKIIFSRKNIFSTLYLWICYFIAFMTLYFFLNWLPSILTAAGLELSEGVSATVYFSLGGVAGMLVLGYFSNTIGPNLLLGLFFLCCCISTLALAMLGDNLQAVLIISAVIGFFAYGIIGGLYAAAAKQYPPEARTTGVAWAIGIGRFGSISGPVLTGYLYSLGWIDAYIYMFFALPPLIAVFALYLLAQSLMTEMPATTEVISS